MSEVAALAQLISVYGSPLYVYDLDEVEAAADRLQGWLPRPSALYYSFKANPHPWIARALRGRGCRAEISSSGELAAALEAGFTGEECLYTGPGKTAAELDGALAAGVRQFSVESAVDFRRVADRAERLGVTASCLIRVHAAGAHGASGVRMSGTPSQFGITAESLLATRDEFAPRNGSHVTGAHFFPLSNARDEASLIAEMTHSIAEAARLGEAGIPLRTVDLGGGFAAPYARPGALPSYPALENAVTQALDTWLPGWRDGTPEIAFESGRHLTGTAGRLLCTVTDVKTSHGRSYVVADAGVNHLGGLSALGRIRPVSVHAEPLRSAAELPGGDVGREATGDRAVLVGPLCAPADILTRDLAGGLELCPGDVLTVPNVGAYGLTSSLLGFLSHPAAAEVVLRGGEPVDVSRLSLVRTACPAAAVPAPTSSVPAAPGASDRTE